MRSLLVILTVWVMSQRMQAQINESLAQDLQEFLDNSVSLSGNNGVSAHLIMPDGTTWTGVAGLDGQGDPITDTTVFIGASTTKFNLAVLMMLLVEEELLDLDMPWTDYLSLDLPFDASITLRQLLNHTSGIADYLETASSGSDITNDFDFFYTPQNIVQNIVESNPEFAPGTGFQYSNSNYVMLGLIIEEVTGNPLNQELRTRIWEPLGMEHTYFGAYDEYSEAEAGVWWDFGLGLTNYSDVPKTSMLSYAYGAGNIVSCPSDLSVLVNSTLSGDLIELSSMIEMVEFVPASFGSWTAGYGLGIHMATVPTDDEVLGHDGYYANLTDMFKSSDYGFTLVTMTNTQTTWFGLYDPMYELVVDQLLSTDLEDLETSVRPIIFPNPSNGEVTISGLEIGDEIELIDALGKVIHNEKVSVYRPTIRVVLPGCYQLIVKSGYSSVVQRLLVN